MSATEKLNPTPIDLGRDLIKAGHSFATASAVVAALEFVRSRDFHKREDFLTTHGSLVSHTIERLGCPIIGD